MNRRKSGKKDIDRLKNLFAEDRDLYIFVSSLGAEQNGATPFLVKVAEEMGLNSREYLHFLFLLREKEMDSD
jgi:hypothetical protein